MGILSWIIFGGIAGWIASQLTGEQDGCLTNIVVGIVGAMLGGFIYSSVGGHGVTGFNLISLLVAVAGAVILIAILRDVRRGR